MGKYAEIISFEEWNKIRQEKGEKLGKIVCTSGGFDPIHPGHATCLVESKAYGDTLVVVVNGDTFLKNKKGKAFQDVDTRCNIVACIREVDYVIPFEIDGDQSVNVALQRIKPHIFTKGGDRTDMSNISEWKTCQDLGIEVISGVGLAKKWSSSDFLKDWGEFYKKNK
jgi:cytidyltransferase-like protein